MTTLDVALRQQQARDAVVDAVAERLRVAGKARELDLLFGLSDTEVAVLVELEAGWSA